MKFKNYTITRIEPALWKEFMTACRHFDFTARASFLYNINEVIENFRRYKEGYMQRLSSKSKKGEK